METRFRHKSKIPTGRPENFIHSVPAGNPSNSAGGTPEKVSRNTFLTLGIVVSAILGLAAVLAPYWNP